MDAVTIQPRDLLDEGVKAYQECLYLEPDEIPIVEAILVCSMGAVWTSQDIPWLLIIGPPSCGKTELLLPLRDRPDVQPFSFSNPKGLMSGYRGAQGDDPSLMSHVDGKIVVMEDMTSVLSQRTDVVEELFGIFRQAYDGGITKSYGNVGVVTYRGRFGLLCASTNHVDVTRDRIQSLGERFLSIRFPSLLGRSWEARMAFNAGRARFFLNKGHQRAKLKTTLSAILDRARLQLAGVHASTVSIPTAISQKINTLAAIVTLARTQPLEGYSTDPERHTRVHGQLAICGQIHAVLAGRTEVTDDDYVFVLRLARDTLTPRMLSLLRAIYNRTKAKGSVTRDQLLEGIYHSEDFEKGCRQLGQYRDTGLVAQVSRLKWAMDPLVLAELDAIGLGVLLEDHEIPRWLRLYDEAQTVAQNPPKDVKGEPPVAAPAG